LNIVVDTREQSPFSFADYDCTAISGTLTTGDYSVVGLENRCAVERKSLDDLLGCLTGEGRDRFERELQRSKGLDAFAVVIEASMQDMAEHKYRSRMKPHAALQSVLAFTMRYRVPFIWSGSRNGAEYATYHFLRHYLRDMREIVKAIQPALSGEKGV
jgi:DNA excision repair protein ERCC-4